MSYASRTVAAFVTAGLVALVTASSFGDDRTWSLSGEFSAFSKQSDDVVVIRTAAGALVEVPLESLSDADRDVIARSASGALRAAEGADGVVIKGPGGKNVTLFVPPSLVAVETDAILCRTAADAAQVYRIFLANRSHSEEVRKAAEARLSDWTKLEADQKVRCGERWVAAQEYADARRKSEEMVKHARELLRLGQYRLSGEELRKASSLNPESGKADFFLGWVYSLGFDDYKRAVSHFAEVVAREPGNPWALNNLAICELFADKALSSVGHFRSALDILPEPQVVADNLGIALALAAQRKLKVPSKALADLSDLYRTAIQELQLQPLPEGAQLTLVFVSPYGKTWDGKGVGGQRRVDETSEEDARVIGSGSGVVVAPGYVLTNKHVVADATQVAVMESGKKRRLLPAEVVAAVDDPDLALLRCEDLKAPAVSLAAALPRRGSDVMALGYPLGVRLGLTLKSTRGTVISDADPDLPLGGFLHSATVNGGNSGGPIVDQRGSLVGVVVAGTTRALAENTYGIGVPVEQILAFVRQHLPETKVVDGDAKPMDWPDVDSSVSPSTVYVECVVKINRSVGQGE